MLLMEHHHGRLRRRGGPVAEAAVCLNTFGDHGNLKIRLKSQFSSGKNRESNSWAHFWQIDDMALIRDDPVVLAVIRVVCLRRHSPHAAPL